MNKKEFIRKFATKTELTLKDAELCIDKFIECIEEVMLAGDEITFKNFGKFCVKERQARKGINPQTKEMIEYPAKKVGKFVQAKALGEKINK